MTWHKVMWSSQKMDYSTPQEIFDELDREFHFTLDACATKENAKCDHYFTLEDDALSKVWHGEVFMNPPYGREIKKWVQKAYEEAWIGRATVVCLLPSRTDTKWFHGICAKGEIRFLEGRIKFDGKNSAPFPSMLVIFRAGEVR